MSPTTGSPQVESGPKCVVILGMHRSGTSCLTRILSKAGLYLGQELLLEARCDNLLGHWESMPVLEINERILSESGGTWIQIPQRLVASEAIHNDIDTCLEMLRRQPIYGWKEPRTTITWPIWQEHIKDETTLIVCLRHPYAVAESLMRREQWGHDAGVSLWYEYNKRIRDYVSDDRPVLWFPYSGNPEEVKLHLQHLLTSLNLECTEEILELFNPHLDHSHSFEEIKEMEVRNLYQELLSLANRQAVEPQETASAPANEAAIGRGNILNQQAQQGDGYLNHYDKEINRLSEVVASLSYLTQQYNHQFNQINHQTQQINHQTQQFDQRLSKLEEQSQAQIRELETVRLNVNVLEERLQTINERLASLEESTAQVLTFTNHLRGSLIFTTRRRARKMLEKLKHAPNRVLQRFKSRPAA